LKHQQLEITDIFKSAYLLCKGGDLAGIRIKSNGRRIALFLIKGDNLDELDRDLRISVAISSKRRSWSDKFNVFISDMT